MKLLTGLGGLGVVGIAKDSDSIIDISFDILSLEALFLVPRWVVSQFSSIFSFSDIADTNDTSICSVMSLNPYFGSLVGFPSPEKTRSES